MSNLRTNLFTGDTFIQGSSDPSIYGSGRLNIDGDLMVGGTFSSMGGSTFNTLLINGTISGTISIVPQPNSGTYNYNLPITAGIAGQVLTSQGGGSTAMTWSTPITSVGISLPAFLSVSNSPLTANGTLAVTLSGTALPILNGGTGSTTATGSGSVVLQTSPTLITPNIGSASGTGLILTSTLSSFGLVVNGSISGSITILTSSITNTYNFVLPSTVGTAGQVLTSQAGSTMTWTSMNTGTVTSVALSVPSFLSVSGSPVTTSGTLGITLSGTALPITSGGTGSTTATGSGSVVLQTSPTLTTPILGVATGTSLSVSGNVNSLTHTFTGSTSGVITIQTQANAGTYNYNLPTTAGSAGQVLTSQGGGSSAMIWTNANTGTVTSVALTVPSFLSVSGSPITSSGTLAVTLSGTALPILNGGTGSTTATGTGQTVLATSPTLVTPNIGVASGTSLSVTGQLTSTVVTGTAPLVVSSTTNVANLNASSLNGATFASPGAIGSVTPSTGVFTTFTSNNHLFNGTTSGTITMQPQATAGTYNFNLPTTAGTAGQVLTSQGGGSSAMIWTSVGVGSVTSVALSVPSFLSVSGSPITTNGTLAVTLSGTALPILNGGTGSTTATGSGSVVLQTSPTLTTPILGVATGTSLSVSGNVNSLTHTFTGSTSGVITIQTQANAGTYNYNLPTTAGSAGQVLTSQGGLGTAMTWTSVGSVTSVALSVPSFLSVSGSPITTNGTLAVTFSGTALPILNGGTGSTTATGSGSVVLQTSPTLTTPVLGVATGTSLSVTGQLTSSISTGTAPLVVNSSTVVTNLNANFLNGATFASPGTIGTGTASSGAFTTLSTSNLYTANNGITIATGTLTAITGTFTGQINMNLNKITNLATPTLATDAANKAYVDGAVQGLSTKESVVVSSTVNGTLATAFANGQVLDGITLVTGMRILIQFQTTQTENGIYTVNSSGAPTRTTDFSSGSSVSGAYTFVEQGTLYADAGFVCTSNTPNDVVGTNNITFVQFSGAGQIIAGTGLTKTGNTLSVNALQTQITALGTLGSLTVTSAIAINGSSTGTITIQTQANSGTYNFNLPITVGTAGQVLTSQAGGVMTWSSVGIGSVTSVALSVPSFLSVSGSPITTNGTLAVTLSGTALPILNGGTGSTTATGSGSVVLQTSPTLTTPILGVATGTSLSVSANVNSLTHTITGSTSGVITIQAQANAGTYNFNLPTTAGTAGQVLTSQGGAGTAMTWTSVGSGTVTSVALTVPTFLSVSGSPITTNGTFAVTLSGTALPILNGGTGSTTATGSGSVVLQTSPTLTTPVLGIATGTSLSVSGQLTSTVSTGTPPLVVSSTTNVPNLNASSLNGATFASPGVIGSGTASSATFTTATITNTTLSTNTSTGSLVVNGGIGIGGNIVMGNNITSSSILGSYFKLLNGTFTDNATPASSTLTAWASVYIDNQTLSATNTSVTTTTASTVYIDNSPLVGTNQTITNRYSLNIRTGNVLLGLGTIFIGTPGGNAIQMDTNFLSGSWINMPTTGPSGIGTGGAGVNPWLAYVSLTGEWFTDSAPGDLAYRNTSGRLLWGFSTGTSAMQMSSTGIFNISTNTISTSSTTGALTVAGGLGISRNVFIGTNLTASSSITSGAYLTVTGSTFTDNSTAGSGTLSLWASSFYARPTLAATNTVVTTTNACTLYIAGSVINGTNETLTNSWALYIATGNNFLGTGTTRATTLSTTTALITGSTSGTITLQGQAAAGTYNWNYPTTAGTAGQVLTSQGGGATAMTWSSVGIGSVTSVALTVPTFLSVTGSPITTNGTLAVTLSGTALPILNGGTGSTTATGSGSVVLATSPTLVTPNIGVATGTSLNLSATTVSTSITTGGLITAGGIGINDNLFMGSAITGPVVSSTGSLFHLNTLTFTNNGTAASGTLPNWTQFFIGQPTVASTTTSNTTTNAYNLFIAGAPLNGTNNTITNRFSLYVASGDVFLGTGVTTATSVSTDVILLTGSTSGTITLQTQANAGTYNWNYPITSGTSGQVLTSQGGGATAMIWTTPVTSVGLTVPAFLSVTGSPVTSAGTFNVTLSGTALPIINGGTGSTTATGSGSVVLETSPTLVTPNIGTATGTSLSVTGDVDALTHSISGSTSGVITIQAQAVAGTYNYNLPTTSGTAGQVLTSQGGSGTAMTWTTLVSNVIETYWIISDQKTSGTSGGTFTSGAFQTRTLNTITSSQVDTSVTLSGNNMVITPGTYLVTAQVPAYKVGNNVSELFNVTANSSVGLGTNATSATGDNSTSTSFIERIISVVSTTSFSIRHRCVTTANTTGFGIAHGFGTETYTQVKIKKIV